MLNAVLGKDNFSRPWISVAVSITVTAELNKNGNIRNHILKNPVIIFTHYFTNTYLLIGSYGNTNAIKKTEMKKNQKERKALLSSQAGYGVCQTPRRGIWVSISVLGLQSAGWDPGFICRMWQVLFSMVPYEEPDHWAGRSSSTVPGSSERGNHQHLQILNAKLLTRWPVEVLGSLCLLRKNTHGWQWQLMNSFLEANIDFIFELQGDLGKLRFLRACWSFFPPSKLRIETRGNQWGREAKLLWRLSQVVGSAICPKSKSTFNITLLHGIYSNESSLTSDRNQRLS